MRDFVASDHAAKPGTTQSWQVAWSVRQRQISLIWNKKTPTAQGLRAQRHIKLREFNLLQETPLWT